jgi:hypothetical protein
MGLPSSSVAVQYSTPPEKIKPQPVTFQEAAGSQAAKELTLQKPALPGRVVATQGTIAKPATAVVLKETIMSTKDTGVGGGAAQKAATQAKVSPAPVVAAAVPISAPSTLSASEALKAQVEGMTQLGQQLKNLAAAEAQAAANAVARPKPVTATPIPQDPGARSITPARQASDLQQRFDASPTLPRSTSQENQSTAAAKARAAEQARNVSRNSMLWILLAGGVLALYAYE